VRPAGAQNTINDIRHDTHGTARASRQAGRRAVLIDRSHSNWAFASVVGLCSLLVGDRPTDRQTDGRGCMESAKRNAAARPAARPTVMLAAAAVAALIALSVSVDHPADCFDWPV